MITPHARRAVFATLALPLPALAGSALSSSEYGDLGWSDQGPGTIDDFMTYSPPSAFLTWVQANADNASQDLAISDDLANGEARRYPFVLAGHDAFDSADVEQAILSFDYRYDPDATNPGNDGIAVWNEGDILGQTPVRFNFGSRVIDGLKAVGMNNEQFLRVSIDLTTGQAELARVAQATGAVLEDLGPIGGPWGSETGDNGSAGGALSLAEDGDLFGLVEDDAEILVHAKFEVAAQMGGDGSEFITAVVENDLVAGVGLVTSIDNIAINDNGEWLVEVDTNNANTEIDGAIVSPDGLVLQHGDSVADPAGATISSFDSVTLNATGQSGFNHFLDGTPGGENDSGVYISDDLLIQEGDISTASGFTAGTPYIGFFDVKINDDGDVLIVASVDDPGITSTVDRALVIASESGELISEEVIAAEGDILPGTAEPITDFGTGPHTTAFNNDGDALYFADLDGATSSDGTIWLFNGSTSTLIAREGDASPIAGRSWASLASPELDLNDNGSYIFSGTLTGDTGSDLLIAVDGEKFVQEGDPAPGGFEFTTFGTGPLHIGNDGGVLWYGDWNDPDDDVDTGLFHNDDLIIQEGVTVIEGSVVDTIRGIEDGYHLSPSGEFAIAELVLLDGREVAVIIDLGDGGEPPVGCDADVTGDGDTTSADLNVLLANFGDTGSGLDGDYDEDGDVDSTDLNVLLADFGCEAE